MVFTGRGEHFDRLRAHPDSAAPGGLGARTGPSTSTAFRVRPKCAVRRGGAIVIDDATPGARPNAAHRAVARFGARGRAALVVTQNIDGLHGASGVPAERLVELHGNGTYAACLDCKLRHELADIRTAPRRLATRRPAGTAAGW